MMIGVGGMITTICLLWYYDATAFRYCKCGDAVGNRQRRVNAAASAIDESKSSANNRERLFQKRLEQLYEYRKLHGHGSIPTPYPTNPSLGIWAANIRRQYTLYTKQSNTPYTGYLTPARQKQLLLAGFDFTSLTERQFQSRLNELLLFKKQHGHCMVPEKWESNPTLGAWVSNIRTLYRKKQRIDDDDASSTNISNGNVQNNRQRRKMKVLLSSKKLMKKQKATKQKRSPRFTHLDEERINLLTQIGFAWSSIDKKWFEMLEWAKVYGVVNYQVRQQSVPLSMEGGCDYVIYLEDDKKSSNTTTAMEQHQYNKSSYNITRLIKNYYTLVHNIQNQTLLSRFYPQDNIFTMLLNLDSTNVNENDDINNYHFQSSHLDYRVPPNDTYHQSLRIWMINQRSNYNRLNDYQLNSICTTTATNTTATSLLSSTMTPQRQHALESINFPWSGRYSNRIEEVQYEKLRQERLEEQRRQLERKAKKEQDERERIERLLLSPKLNSPVKLDVMDLWAAEDDDDNDIMDD